MSKRTQYRDRKAARDTRKVIIVMGAVALIIGLIIYASLGHDSTRAPRGSTAGGTRTQEELMAFWMREMQGIVVQFDKADLPYADLNDRYASLVKQVKAETSNLIAFEVIMDYAKVGGKRVPGALASAEAKANGARCIKIWLPAIEDIFELHRVSGYDGWREVFKSHMIVTIIHELEHIVSDHVRKRIDHFELEEESRAWAETCRYTLVPLVEKYHVPLNPNDQTYYDAWKSSGGDTNSTDWKKVMDHYYGSFDKKSP